jgi:lipopolysaccharide biosynthesis regulator YciM
MVAGKITVKKQIGRQPKKTCERCGSETLSMLLFKCCPSCNSKRIATLAETGEKYCRACGLVLL